MPTRLTIIGAGPGGYVAAIRAAQMGAQVTVVEESEVGGTCLNWGCIPTKTLIASTEALEHVHDFAEFGVELIGEVRYNLNKIRERKDRVVATQVKGIRALFKSRKITLIPGKGSLLSKDVVRAVQKDGTTQDIRSDRIIIATGSRPARVAGFPFDGETVMTSDDAVQLKTIPKHLLIIGAGVIGCEFAFIYRSLGSAVTLVELLPRALSTEDEDMSGIIERELKKAKITLITSASVIKIGTATEGGMIANLSNGQEVRADAVLVSIGRSLNTENLRLEDAGLATGMHGEIPVNEKMETSVPDIYAVGDVTGKMLLAHVASRQGIIAAENSMGGDERMDYSSVPAGIFTRPEIGSVGIREHQAREQGIAIKVGRFPYRALGKAHAAGEITGLFKVIADAGTDKVLGMHICGAHASDLVHEGALAIRLGATSQQLGEMVHAHPTFAEGIGEAAEDVFSRAIHLPGERTDRR
jgi:dihydrolipoamide dehydrogenase